MTLTRSSTWPSAARSSGSGSQNMFTIPEDKEVDSSTVGAASSNGPGTAPSTGSIAQSEFTLLVTYRTRPDGTVVPSFRPSFKPGHVPTDEELDRSEHYASQMTQEWKKRSDVLSNDETGIRLNKYSLEQFAPSLSEYYGTPCTLVNSEDFTEFHPAINDDGSLRDVGGFPNGIL
ncbi:hypothetical protein IAT40_005181 [Kwoniella sp. CBS 6097]